MSTIQAIETAYKGYRFRSRLEARWAMFYDRAGCEWTYETEPLLVSGEAYLPDFLVTRKNNQIIHEVKAGHERTRIRAPRVYLAGKMSPQHDWRNGVCHEHPCDPTNSPTEWLDQSKIEWLGDSCIDLVGPFSMGGNHNYIAAHAAAHAAESLYASHGAEDEVLDNCLVSIRHSDIVCVHISTKDAYGTLAEVGYAKGADTSPRISLSVDQGLCRELAILRGGKHGSEWNSHDLWFVSKLADKYAIVDGFAEARAFHSRFIQQHTTHEFRRISGIGKARPAALTFGDPLDVALYAGHIQTWKGGWEVFNLCLAHRTVAEQVRAHRFDGR